MAEKAKGRLRELLAVGEITLQRQGLDRYGRTLANIRVGGLLDVGEVLRQEGLALSCSPGKEAWEARKRVWCAAS